MDDYLFNHFWPFLVFIVGAIFLLLVGIRQVDHHYTALNCPKQGVAYARQTKFVDYNYWNYECLVKTSKGIYVPINNQVNNIVQE